VNADSGKHMKTHEKINFTPWQNLVVSSNRVDSMAWKVVGSGPADFDGNRRLWFVVYFWLEAAHSRPGWNVTSISVCQKCPNILQLVLQGHEVQTECMHRCFCGIF